MKVACRKQAVPAKYVTATSSAVTEKKVPVSYQTPVLLWQEKGDAVHAGVASIGFVFALCNGNTINKTIQLWGPFKKRRCKVRKGVEKTPQNDYYTEDNALQ